MNKQAVDLTIGALARAAGVHVETVRFYQRRGLLAAPEKPYGGIRRYRAADVARLRFVKTAQRLGFSLDEVAGLLRLEDGSHCEEARQFAEQKLAEVRARQAELQRVELALARLVDDCCRGGGTVSCPLIAALTAG